MRELKEDNNGFIQFPFMEPGMKLGDGKTLVYIVVFDEFPEYILSNTILKLPGGYVTDDIAGRCFILNKSEEVEGDLMSFLYDNDGDSLSLVSSVCIGWNNNSLIKENGEYWYANFRSLTNEGRKIYYSLKKLHNNKEVRILTFNEVK